MAALQVALLQSAASTWATIITETELQAQLQQQIAAQAATAKRTGKVRRLRDPAPWQSLGSEVEIQEHCTSSSRPPAKVSKAGLHAACSAAPCAAGALSGTYTLHHAAGWR